MRKRIKSADGVVDALRAIADERASGALIVKSGDKEASIVVVDGRITGAAMSPSGERGDEVLEILGNFKRVKLRYSKFYAMHSAGPALDVPVEDLLAKLDRAAAAPTGADQSNERKNSQAHTEVSPKETPAVAPVSEQLQPAQQPAPAAQAPAIVPTPTPEVAQPEAPSAQPESPQQQPQSELPAKQKKAKHKKPAKPRKKSHDAIIISAVGLSVLGFLCYWLPEKIKTTAGGGTIEEQAAARLRASLQNTLTSDMPIESVVLVPNPPRKGPLTSVDDIPVEEPVTEDLRFARVLVQKGKIDKAAGYYENYLKMYPNSINPRIELVNVYLATNHRPEARLLCLQTLKKNLTSNQVGSVWQLLSQCQTD